MYFQFLDWDFGDRVKELRKHLENTIKSYRRGDGDDKKKEDNCLFCISAFVDKSWLLGHKYLIEFDVKRAPTEEASSGTPNETTIETTNETTTDVTTKVTSEIISTATSGDGEAGGTSMPTTTSEEDLGAATSETPEELIV